MNFQSRKKKIYQSEKKFCEAIMKKIKTVTALLLSALMVFSLFGCSDKKIITQENTQNSTEDSVTEVTQAVKSSFVWQPHVFQEKLAEYYGDEIKQDFYNFIDAVIAGHHFSECSSEKNMNIILYQFQYMFPVMFKVVSAEECSFEDGGYLTIVYSVDDAVREKTINDFKNSIESLVKSSIADDDTAVMKAAALYAGYVAKISYNNENDVNSPYRALTEYTGICQSFAYAYAYLCMQCGIDATVVTSVQPAHMWVMMDFDGKMYYADPTYESTGKGMMLFGMNIDERLSSQDFSGIEVMYAMQSSEKNYVSDDRFSEIRKVAHFESIERKDGRMFINGKDTDGNVLTAEVI